MFPCEEEIIERLTEATTSVHEEEEIFQEEPVLKPNQHLAVIWDEGTKKIWYVGFYVDDNGDGTFRADHLIPAANGDNLWQSPSVPGI